MCQTLTINSNLGKCKITIKAGLFLDLGKLIKDLYPNKKIAFITDNTVKHLYEYHLTKQMHMTGIDWILIPLPEGEEGKSFDMLPKLYSVLLDFQLSRDDLIVALGGGAICDIAAFAAATFLRGVGLIQIPTTLMAMVDAGIGGKNAVNLRETKNMVGAFYYPKEVFIDPDFIKTLPNDVFADGMSEVVKYACVFDHNLFIDLLKKTSVNYELHLEPIIYRSCLIRKQAIEKDCRYQGVSMLLSFGRTIARCIESFYSEKIYTHGQALAIGMYTMTLASEKKALTIPNTSALLKKLLIACELPYSLHNNTDLKDIIKLVIRDEKRRSDRLDLILLEKIGKGYIHQIKADEFADFLNI